MVRVGGLLRCFSHRFGAEVACKTSQDLTEFLDAQLGPLEMAIDNFRGSQVRLKSCDFASKGAILGCFWILSGPAGGDSSGAHAPRP